MMKFQLVPSVLWGVCHMSFAIFRSDSSAVASSHKEMTSFDLGVNFLASFIKVTEMSDMSKLKKQDPVTLSDLSREIIRVCAEKDSGVKSHIQVPGVDDEVGRVMVLIRELYKVKAEAVFNEVHKDADRVSTYKTLVRLYHFVWGISETGKSNDERSYANSLSGVFRPPEDELVDKKVTLGTLFFPWTFGAYTADKETSDSIIDTLELISYSQPTKEKILDSFNAFDESKICIGFFEGKGSSSWSPLDQIKERAIKYLEDAESGKLKIEKCFGVSFAENEMKRRAIDKELSAAIRIIELFRALDFKSYTCGFSTDICWILGKTHFFDDKVETKVCLNTKLTSAITDICPHFVYNREVTYLVEIKSEAAVTEDILRKLQSNILFKSVDFKSFQIAYNTKALSIVLSYIGKNKLKAKVSMTWDYTVHQFDELLAIDEEARQGLSDVATEISLDIYRYWKGNHIDHGFKPFESFEEAAVYINRFLSAIPSGVRLSTLSYYVKMEGLGTSRELLSKSKPTGKNMEEQEDALPKALGLSKTDCAKLGEAGLRSLEVSIFRWRADCYKFSFKAGKTSDEGYSFCFVNCPENSALYIDSVLSEKDAQNIFYNDHSEKLVFCDVTFSDDFINTFAKMKFEEIKKIYPLEVICTHRKESKRANWIDGDFEKVILRIDEKTEAQNPSTSMTMCPQCTRLKDL